MAIILLMQNIKECIKSLDFFKNLNEQDFEQLLKISSLKECPISYTFNYEEDVSDKIVFLVDGLLKAYKVDRQDNEIFLNYIYKNSLVSEVSSLQENAIRCYSNTECVQDSIFLEINYKLFKKYFIETNILTHQFIEEILNNTKQLYCIIDRELVFDAMAKVAYSLYDDLAMFNNLKRQEVANMLHIQPATLSRVLKKLVRQEIITIETTNILISNKKGLIKIFNGASL